MTCLIEPLQARYEVEVRRNRMDTNQSDRRAHGSELGDSSLGNTGHLAIARQGVCKPHGLGSPHRRKNDGCASLNGWLPCQEARTRPPRGRVLAYRGRDGPA